MGDGAFGMSGTDIETAVRSGIAITTVLLNNSAMATYPHGSPMDPVTARTEYGVTHMQGDYATIAEGMGAIGLRASTAAELEAALTEAKARNAEGVTVLIDVAANVEARRSPTPHRHPPEVDHPWPSSMGHRPAGVSTSLGLPE